MDIKLNETAIRKMDLIEELVADGYLSDEEGRDVLAVSVFKDEGSILGRDAYRKALGYGVTSQIENLMKTHK
jgi:polyhydroxyalkanoate synthesis regulator phasin